MLLYIEQLKLTAKKLYIFSLQQQKLFSLKTVMKIELYFESSKFALNLLQILAQQTLRADAEKSFYVLFFIVVLPIFKCCHHRNSSFSFDF